MHCARENRFVDLNFIELILCGALEMKTLLLLCCLAWTMAWAQAPQQLWTQRYGGPYTDAPYAICNTPDGGVLLAGWTRIGSGFHDGLLMRLNAAGDSVWSATYGGANHDELWQMIPVSTGGYLLCGITRSMGNGNWDKWLVRIDDGGTVQWETTFGNAGEDFVTDVCELTDGDFVISGSGLHGLLRVTSGGAFVWSSATDFKTVEATPDGGFVAVRMNIDGSLALSKFTVDNTLEWTQNYLSEVSYWCWYTYAEYSKITLSVMSDGYFLATNLYDDWFGSKVDLRRVDLTGGLVWRKLYDPRQYSGVSKVVTMSDGNLALLCAAAFTDESNLLAILSPEGNLLSQNFNTLYKDVADLVQTGDGGFAMFGRSGDPNWQFRVTRYTALGPVLNCGELQPYFDEEYCWPDRHRLLLRWSAGEVSRVAITGFCPGTYGYLEGDAANTWYVLPNGDGNDGDSIIFQTDTPLTADTIGYFRLYTPSYCRDEYSWNAGDVNGYLDYPLAVELLSFEANAGDNVVELHWSTASETDNDHFEIRRDGELMAVVSSQGNGTSQHDYTWNDYSVTNGVTYSYELSSVDVSGNIEVLETQSATPRESAVPLRYELLGNYPNPFNPVTNISFVLAETQFVKVRVFNTRGQEVAALGNATMAAGEHTLAFDARDLGSGVYLYEIEAGPFRANGKMVLIR